MFETPNWFDRYADTVEESGPMPEWMFWVVCGVAAVLLLPRWIRITVNHQFKKRTTGGRE